MTLDDRFAVVVVFVAVVVVVVGSSDLRSSGCLVKLKVRLELVLSHESGVATDANEWSRSGVRQKMLKNKNKKNIKFCY